MISYLLKNTNNSVLSSRLFTLVFILSGSVLLTSCASMNDQGRSVDNVDNASVEPVTWVVEQQKRKQIHVWEVRGRLGVQTATNGGSMDIIWKQSAEEFSIHLIAPLGAGTYHIQGDSTYAEIRYPSGDKKVVDNLDEIFVSSLNVKLPVSAIKDWIRGLPANALPVESIRWNKAGLLHRVQQSGWNVELKKYAGGKQSMPHALYVNRDDDAELDIRLALRQWLIDN